MNRAHVSSSRYRRCRPQSVSAPGLLPMLHADAGADAVTTAEPEDTSPSQGCHRRRRHGIPAQRFPNPSPTIETISSPQKNPKFLYSASPSTPSKQKRRTIQKSKLRGSKNDPHAWIPATPLTTDNRGHRRRGAARERHWKIGLP